MRKGIYKRLLAGMLCVVMILTNSAAMEISVQAAEIDLMKNKPPMTDLSEENVELEDGTQQEENVRQTGSERTERETDESTEGAFGETEGVVEESEGDKTENSGGENNFGESEGSKEEGGNGDAEKGEKGDEVEADGEGISAEDTEGNLESIDSVDNIASGVNGNITWVIDKDGKLTVEGTGDFYSPNDYRHAPWYNNRTSIVSAEINVIDMTDANYMFYECSNLVNVDLKNFDTSKIKFMRSMFEGCSSLSEIDLSNFNTSSVSNMPYMFKNCSSLTNVDLNNFVVFGVISFAGMFEDCVSLTNIDLSNFRTSYMASNMSYMFDGCKNLKSLDISNFYTGEVTNMAGMFENCKSLTSLDVSNFDTHRVTDMSRMFAGCSSLTSLDVSSFYTKNVADMAFMFSECDNLLNLNLEGFDTTRVSSMSGMFRNCSNLISLDVSKFNTYGVKHMDSMFENCCCDLDLSNFDTSTVEYMRNMFQGCEMESLDLSRFDTSNVRFMDYMFANSSFTNLDLENFNTSNVTDMSYMFNGCSSLTSLDIENFNTSNVTNMSCMFNGCSSLTSLDLSNFDMRYVRRASSMLGNCISLVQIYTPTNVVLYDYEFIDLPIESGDTWYCPDGTEIKQLPKNLSYSILIKKNRIPTEDNPEEDPVDDELKYIQNLTQVSLKNADTESKKSIESAIYNLLFKAEYRPTESKIPSDTMTFTGSKDVIAKWPIQNKDYNTQAYWNRTVNDAQLGSIKFNNAGAGCMAYAYFATTYTYGTNGSAKKCSNISANGIKEFIHQYADPGEHLRYEKPHSIVFLGESLDGEGFYCISYEGGVSKRGTYHLLRLMYKSYENFASEVAGKLSIFDTNNGSYYNGTAKTVTDVRNGNSTEKIITRLACPIEATIELNGEILDSRNPGTASYGTVERDGDEIIFTLDYSPDYNLSIIGTGEGMMTLTLEYYGDSNTLIDQRQFVSFPIKDSIEIQSSGFDSQSTFILYTLDDLNEIEEAWGASVGETVDAPNNVYRGDNIPEGDIPVSGENIAEGSFKTITWVIDGDGKLTVEGSGNFSDSYDDDRAPWYKHRTSIVSAEVNVTGMTDASYMFYGCSNLTSLDVSNFDTRKVGSMWSMFENCSSLTSLDLSSFNTSQVYDMDRMFSGCENLTSLNLSSFDAGKVEYTDNIFADCTSLTKINTPYNLKYTVPLPVEAGEVWTQPDGTEIFNLPINLSESIEIVRGEKKIIAGENIASGSCKDIIWTIDDAGKLTVEGNVEFSDPYDYCRAPWFNYRTFIKSAKIDVTGVTDASYMFYGCENLTSIDVKGFDTSKVTDMSWMFFGCSSLNGLDLSSFDTGNVIDMSSMFMDCSSLSSLNLGRFNTGEVEEMRSMFSGCSSLSGLNLSSFDTSKVRDMSYMFSHCSSLTSLNLSGTDTGTVSGNGISIFAGGFDTSNVTNMGYMFNCCYSLTSLNVSNFDTSKVWNMAYMFNGCNSLKSLNISNFDTIRIVSMENMFYDCSSLTTIYTPYNLNRSIKLPSKLGEVWTTPDGTEITELPKNLSSGIKITKEKGNYGDIKWEIDSNGKLTVTGTGDFSDSMESSRAPWYEDRASIKSAEVNVTGMTDASYMFNGCENLVSVDVSGFDTSKVTNMYGMFQNCSSLASLDLRGIDTGTVSGNGLPIFTEGFDTSRVTNMSYMFTGCSSLTSLYLSSFDTSQVTNMNGMFNGCSSLTELDLSSFNAHRLTQGNNTDYPMLYNCSSLIKIKTPCNLKYTTLLPIENGEVWTQPDGTEILDLPINLSESIEIVRGKKNIVSGENIASGKYKDITWTIDDAGKLTAEGRGDFLNYNNSYNRAPWSNYRTFIKSAKINITGMTNAAYMFYGCTNLTSIDLSGFDTSKVISMYRMFYDCSSLTSLDLSGFKTNKVVSMSWMFYNCSSLINLDLSSFDTSQVTSMDSMFYNCSSLTSVDLSSFNTGKVTLMHWMFLGCSSLTSLDLSNFNTSKVIRMGSMFSGCSSLRSLDVSSFDTSKLTDVWNMFGGCSSLTSLDLSSFDISQVTYMGSIFNNCTSLTTIHTPRNTTSLAELPIQSGGVWTMPDGTEITELPKNLSESIVITKIKKDVVPDNNIASGSYKDITWVIDGDGKLTVEGSGDFSESDEFDRAPWFDYRFSIMSAKVDVTGMTDASCMFVECHNLINLDLSGFDTSQVTNMDAMFWNCFGLSSLDLNGFDTSKVTNMSSMFDSCRSLTSLDLSDFDTSKVTSMSNMFNSCRSLTSLNLGSFNTSKVADMRGMFCDCSSLSSLDVSHFDTSNVTIMTSMFYGCSSLSSLNLSSFDTSKVDVIYDMFNGCSSLTSLDLSNFDMSDAKGVEDMLDGCYSLLTINTPRNLAYKVALPIASPTDRWELPDGSEVKELPQNLSESIIIVRKISEASIIISYNDVTYECGDALNIDDFGITLRYCDTDGTTAIVTDYTTNADEIDMSKSGTKKLIITYKGLTKEIEFTVTEKSYGLKIQLQNRYYSYTGSAIKPEITVTDKGRLLVEGTDYSVKYSNNVNVSTNSKKATVTVIGKGNLSGSVSKNFTIMGVDIDDSSVTAARIVVIAGKKVSTPILYYGSVKLTTKDFTYDKTKTFSLTDENPKLTVKAVSGGNFYGTRDIDVKVVADSAELKAVLQKFTVEIDKDKAKNLIFSGKDISLYDEILNTITVKDKTSKGKIDEVDENGVPNYKIALSQSTNAGTVKITVIGMGGYSGCNITKSCKILPRTITRFTNTTDYITDSTILLIADETSSHIYTSSGTDYGNMTLKWNDEVLTEGKDYKVSYSGNKKVGSNAKCTITFKGNYKGKIFFNFSVEKAKLSADSIDEENGLVIPDMVCKGQDGVYKSKPYVSIDGVVVKASEYEVKYYIDEARTIEMSKTNPLPISGKDSAVVYVEVKAKEKNYTTPTDAAPITGSYTVFTKKAASIALSKARVIFYSDEAGTSKVTKFNYTGNPVIPAKVIVEVDGIPLSYGTDYTYEVVNNVNKGKATVIIKSVDGSKYTGSKTSTFSIIARSIKNYTIQ